MEDKLTSKLTYKDYQKLKEGESKAREEALKKLGELRLKKSNKILALEFGVSESYLTDVYYGRRNLTETMMEKLLG